MFFEALDRRYEAVTSLGEGLNKARVFGLVAQSVAQFVHCDSQTVVKVDGCVGAPKLLLQFLAGDNFPWTLEQGCKQFEGLALEPNPDAGPTQFSRLQIGLKNTELYAHGVATLFCHCHCTRSIHPGEHDFYSV